MRFVIGLIVGLLILPVALLIYVKTGAAPVAALDKPMPLEKFLATMGRSARIKAEAPKQAPAYTPADLEAGADVFKQNCSFCHGLPDEAPPPAAKGMFPDPPQLFTPMDAVTDDPEGVTYWKVRNGIRLSGMPGFKATLSDQQMWDVAALLAHSDNLPQSVLDRLKPTPTTEAMPGAAPTDEKGVGKKKN